MVRLLAVVVVVVVLQNRKRFVVSLSLVEWKVFFFEIKKFTDSISLSMIVPHSNKSDRDVG